MYDYPKLYKHIMGGRSKQDRTIANNTIARFEGDNIVVRLHSTDIATLTPDGAVVLNSGGWHTMTTKERLNQFIPAPYTLGQEGGLWYIYNHTNWDAAPYIYQDGVTFLPSEDGYTVINVATKEDESEAKKLRKQIKQFVNDYMQALINGDIPAPDAGDCWHCYMRTDTGETLGEAFNDVDHLLSHFEESYFVPSLFWRAIEVFRVSEYAKWVLGALWSGEADVRDYDKELLHRQGKSSLQKYLYRQFQLA